MRTAFPKKALVGVKVAIVATRERINKMLENTAVNRGLPMFITDDETEARRWIEGL
jgi:hypothetical protein